MITLYWLRSVPSRWKTFIANRVSEVQHLTAGGVWNHVQGIENPADLISRGISTQQLKSCTTWWEGPPWLKQSRQYWPDIVHPAEDAFLPEVLEEKPICLTIQPVQPHEIFSLWSTFSRLRNVVAYMLRFKFNGVRKYNDQRRRGPLRTDELQNAEKTLVRIAQREAFRDDFHHIEVNGQVSSKSSLKSLNPLIVDGIFHVGGRLRHALIPEGRKHPMILPARHPLTQLIMEHYHLKNLHAGPQFLVACIREKYWPLRVRNLARQVVHSCIKCFRTKPTNAEQLMGDLPPERITPTLPFLRSGVDLCGPFLFRRIRKTAPVKCYVAIFICLVTKAIHIELVYDLSTPAFIMALHRFISRRGRPEIIECDNARNFKGAARELAELAKQFASQQHQADVIGALSGEGIQFKFIPPRSPNFGGLWEAGVKSLKKHLRSTMGNTILNQDEFVTLLARIEACLNSRPLTPMSAEPNDLEVLTPAHFLTLRTLTSFPEPDLSDIPRNRLDRLQENRELLRRIWKRWSTDYLSGLHSRTKWTKQRNNIKIGTMVLVKDDNLPPLKWRYGRVTHVFQGDDGNIRVVNVKTADGEFRRSIAKLCVLPIREPPVGITGAAIANNQPDDRPLLC